MTTSYSLLINTTFVVEAAAEVQFLEHLKSFYIPKAISTGVMQQPRLYRILHNNEEEGTSYALQLYASNHAAYTEWLAERGMKLQRMTAHKFGHAVLSFVTNMEEVAL